MRLFVAIFIFVSFQIAHSQVVDSIEVFNTEWCSIRSTSIDYRSFANEMRNNMTRIKCTDTSYYSSIIEVLANSEPSGNTLYSIDTRLQILVHFKNGQKDTLSFGNLNEFMINEKRYFMNEKILMNIRNYISYNEYLGIEYRKFLLKELKND